MKKRMRSYLLVTIFIFYNFLHFNSGVSEVRIKDIATIRGVTRIQVLGYSIVIGLDGTGDGRRFDITTQTMKNLLQNFDISSTDSRMAPRNAAAVMVTARISPFAKKGSFVDVIVSSMGDATSLEGGMLLLTPLMGKDKQVYAYAQGSISIGGVNIETIGGERYRKNYALVGRVPEHWEMGRNWIYCSGNPILQQLCVLHKRLTVLLEIRLLNQWMLQLFLLLSLRSIKAHRD